MGLGIYSSPRAEIVRSERYMLLLYNGCEGIFGAALYRDDKLLAICERNNAVKVTFYAFINSEQSTVASDIGLAQLLGSPSCDLGIQAAGDGFTYCGDPLVCSESLRTTAAELPMPAAGEDTLFDCLSGWPRGVRLETGETSFECVITTGTRQYVMILRKPFTDIYCGASQSIPMHRGLYGGSQYFRIRNYLDNSEPWCGFHCRLGSKLPAPPPLEPEVSAGTCVTFAEGHFYGVLRYTPDEIVLRGCGSDEYPYRRDWRMEERFEVT